MKQLELYQSISGYRYSIDPFILVDFSSPEKDHKIIDFGAGNGVILLLLATRTTSKIIGLEIQSSLLQHARNNIAKAGFNNQISLIQGDIRFSNFFLRNGYFDLVVSNPPYRKLKSGRLNPNSEKAIARHEILITLPELLENTAKLLRSHGKFVIIYIPERYDELLDSMVKKRIIPKRIRFVHSNKTSDSKMFLVEGIKEGKGNPVILDPLYIYDNDGKYTLEMQKIYDSFNYYCGTDSNREVREGDSACKEAGK